MDLTFGRRGACPPAIIRSYKAGDFSDLIITCGSLTFEVHVVIVCSVSDFFKKSVKFAVGKEAEEKRIDLPEDDPEMIRRLISYCYLGDYDPCDGAEMARFSSIKQHESSTTAKPTYHPRKGASGGSLFAPPQCACLAPNSKNVAQPISTTHIGGQGFIAAEKEANAMQVTNPLTVHATMYALGDKYQVEGLSQLAKTKFVSCLPEHAHSEDFVTAVQIAYSCTPDTNRGLRDTVVHAFRTEFQTDIKQIPGAEAKLDCIDELSFLLIKAWPVKIELERPVQTGMLGGGAQATFGSVSQARTQPGSLFGAPSTRPAPARATAGSLFGSSRP